MKIENGVGKHIYMFAVVAVYFHKTVYKLHYVVHLISGRVTEKKILTFQKLYMQYAK